MEETKDFEEQGWNLAHYAFSKDALKPTVYQCLNSQLDTATNRAKALKTL